MTVIFSNGDRRECSEARIKIDGNGDIIFVLVVDGEEQVFASAYNVNCIASGADIMWVECNPENDFLKLLNE
jgi:hypothetical protein